MQNLSITPPSFRQSQFNFFFIHHNVKTARTCPHPFLLEKNSVASFSVGKEKNSCVKYKEPGGYWRAFLSSSSFHLPPRQNCTKLTQRSETGTFCVPPGYQWRGAGTGAELWASAVAHPEASQPQPLSSGHIHSMSNRVFFSHCISGVCYN